MYVSLLGNRLAIAWQVIFTNDYYTINKSRGAKFKSHIGLGCAQHVRTYFKFKVNFVRKRCRAPNCRCEVVWTRCIQNYNNIFYYFLIRRLSLRLQGVFTKQYNNNSILMKEFPYHFCAFYIPLYCIRFVTDISEISKNRMETKVCHLNLL